MSGHPPEAPGGRRRRSRRSERNPPAASWEPAVGREVSRAAAGGRPGLGIAGLVVLLAGCAAPVLRYQPDRQPSGSPISADYRLAGDRLRVTLETGGYRVEEAWIALADGRPVAPRAIEHPELREPAGVGFGLGGAVEGGSGGWSGGGAFGVTFSPGEGIRGAGQAERLTRVLFALDEVGPPPWQLRVKVVGTSPVEILLDPDKPAAR